MKQNILNFIAFKILISYYILVMTNHLKPNQDRLEFGVYIIKKSSRRSIIYLDDIYICKQNRQFYSSYVANEAIGYKILKMGHISNFLQICLKRNQRSALIFDEHQGLLSDSVQIAFPFILLIRDHF